MTDALLSASAIAKELGVSDVKIKRAIKDLAIAPAAKKGCCNLYSPADLKKIKVKLG